MTKHQATQMFGGTQAAMARALSVTRAAVSRWPDKLTNEQADRIMGAAMRLGLRITPELRRAHRGAN